MRPPERRETGKQDLFRSRLDQIIALKHPLVALGRTVGVPGTGVWGGGSGPFAAADAIDGGAGDPQAHG